MIIIIEYFANFVNIVDSSLSSFDDDDDDELFLWYGWPKKRCLALFSAGTIIKEFLTHREQDLNLFWGMK